MKDYSKYLFLNGEKFTAKNDISCEWVVQENGLFIKINGKGYNETIPFTEDPSSNEKYKRFINMIGDMYVCRYIEDKEGNSELDAMLQAIKHKEETL